MTSLPHNIIRYFAAADFFYSFQDHSVSAAEGGAGDAADVTAEKQLSACFFRDLQKGIVGFDRLAIDGIQSCSCDAP